MTDWDGDIAGDLRVLPPASTAATEASQGPLLSIHYLNPLCYIVAGVLQSLEKAYSGTGLYAMG